MDRYIINTSTSTPFTYNALNFIWNVDNSILPDDNNHCQNNDCPVQLMNQQINDYVGNWTLAQEDRDAVFAAFEVRASTAPSSAPPPVTAAPCPM